MSGFTEGPKEQGIDHLEQWLDALMGEKWATQRATTRQRISGTVDWVVYIAWLREIVAAWRYARQGGDGVWSRRN